MVNLSGIGLWFAAADVIKTVENSKICSFSVLFKQWNKRIEDVLGIKVAHLSVNLLES